MKLIHLSDLHIGKRLNEYSLIDDQKYILSQIIDIIALEKPDAVAIAGDVYDKSLPSTEGVLLFDDFLFSLSKFGIPVFITSGNHDSVERLSFASRLIDITGIHICPNYDGTVKKYQIQDDFGKVNIYMLPFIKPIHVKRYFENENIETYNDAMKVAIGNMQINGTERNVLVCHQFVTGAERSDSEDVSVGGLDNIDVGVFKNFDYVALGHIHKPQNVSSEKIRYCGTPLKYSFSETNDEKSVTVVELKEKGTAEIKLIPLKPLHDLVDLKGKYNDLMLKSFYENTTYQSDFVRITLTDEDDVLNALDGLRTVYKNLMELRYDNTRTRTQREIDSTENISTKSPVDIFDELYEKQNGTKMTDKHKNYLQSLIEKIWEKEI